VHRSISLKRPEGLRQCLWEFFDEPVISTCLISNGVIISKPRDYMCYDIVVRDHVGVVDRLQSGLSGLSVNLAVLMSNCMRMSR